MSHAGRLIRTVYDLGFRSGLNTGDGVHEGVTNYTGNVVYGVRSPNKGSPNRHRPTR